MVKKTLEFHLAQYVGSYVRIVDSKLILILHIKLMPLSIGSSDYSLFLWTPDCVVTPSIFAKHHLGFVSSVESQ